MARADNAGLRSGQRSNVATGPKSQATVQRARECRFTGVGEQVHADGMEHGRRVQRVESVADGVAGPLEKLRA